MALTLNTSHPLYGSLQNLIVVDDDNVIKDLKNPGLVFTQDASAGGIIASRNFGRAFRVTQNGSYDGYGVDISSSINVGTDSASKTTVFLAFNGVFGASAKGNIFGSAFTFGHIKSTGKVALGGDVDANSVDSSGSITLSTTGSPTPVTIAMHHDGDTATGGRLWINGVQDASSPFSNSGGALSWSTSGVVVNAIAKGSANGHISADFVYIAVFKGFTPSDAEIDSLHDSLTGGNAFGLVEGGGGGVSVTVDGVTLTGAGVFVPGEAGVLPDPVADGVVLTGAGTFIPGAVSVGATASFTTQVMKNNVASIMANTAVLWEWRQGTGIGVAPTSVTYGTGTTTAGGVLVVPGLPAGAGDLFVATADYANVFFERGTAA